MLRWYCTALLLHWYCMSMCRVQVLVHYTTCTSLCCTASGLVLWRYCAGAGLVLYCTGSDLVLCISCAALVGCWFCTGTSVVLRMYFMGAVQRLYRPLGQFSTGRFLVWVVLYWCTGMVLVLYYGGIAVTLYGSLAVLVPPWSCTGRGLLLALV